MLPVGLAVSAASALGSYLTNKRATEKAAQENRKNQAIVNNEYKAAQDRYARTPDNYLDTQAGKGIINRAGESLQEANKMNNNNAIKSGATTQQKLAAAKGVNDAYGNIVQNLGQQSTAWQQQKEDRLDAARQQHNQAQMKINEANAESYQNQGQNISNAIGNAGASIITQVGNAQGWANQMNRDALKNGQQANYKWWKF